MRKVSLLLMLAIICVVAMVLAIGMGSVVIAPLTSVNIILNKIFNMAPFGAIDETVEAILWKIRIPRTILAFISGSGLAISGVMMQSVLRNPLASSLTLGVSAGASLGASVAIVFGIGIFGFLTLPIFGLTAGLITVFLALGVAARVDRNLQNNSIILTGMAFSLFASAIVTIIISMSKEHLNRLIFWQMGSFAVKSPEYSIILFPTVLIGGLLVLGFSKQMDIMTLGDEQAMTSGVEAKRMKWVLLSLSTMITGVIVSLVGVVGFVDLFTPHVARKLFGASHKYVIPASALIGGAFMVMCDLLARTLFAPLEIPVGAITSAVGAPFFIYLFFSGRGKAK